MRLLLFIFILCVLCSGYFVGLYNALKTQKRTKIHKKNNNYAGLIKMHWWSKWIIFEFTDDEKTAKYYEDTLKVVLEDIPNKSKHYKIDWSIEAKKNLRPNMVGVYSIYKRHNVFSKWIEYQSYASYNWAYLDFKKLSNEDN
jgi:hypothetical protein